MSAGIDGSQTAPLHRWSGALRLQAPLAGASRVSRSTVGNLLRAGYGACARPGCGCRHFEALDGRCACHHAIEDHW